VTVEAAEIKNKKQKKTCNRMLVESVADCDSDCVAEVSKKKKVHVSALRASAYREKKKKRKTK
jgi:hypothetical protein